MNIAIPRPNRRPKLYLPLFLSPQSAATALRGSQGPFPLSAPELRRVVTEMVG